MEKSVDKLDDAMMWIIRNFSAGAVASINDDGFPAVSPKATFVIIDDRTIAFGDIRSPGTVSNLKARPHTEINFIDVIHRRAVRVAGTASVIGRDSGEWHELEGAFAGPWQPYLHLMRHFVVVRIREAKLVNSPAYDIGLTEDELKQTNLDKLNSL